MGDDIATDLDRLLGVEEVCRHLGMKPRAARDTMLNMGAFLVGRRLVVSKSLVDEWQKAMAREAIQKRAAINAAAEARSSAHRAPPHRLKRTNKEGLGIDHQREPETLPKRRPVGWWNQTI